MQNISGKIDHSSDLLGYNVYNTLESIGLSEHPIIINTINAYSYVVAKRDDVFKEALKSSDILLPDGFPVVLAAKLLHGRQIKKIAGEQVFYYLLDRYKNKGGKFFFLGSTETTLLKIKNKMDKEYPNIKVETLSPPFKEHFLLEDDEKMNEKINSFAPDVLLIGMTAPKQEKWVYQNQENLNAEIVCSIGAVFDFYAGNVQRPSEFWIRNNLEWFVRFLKEPRRLWKRYFIYSPQILFDVIKELIKCRKNK